MKTLKTLSLAALLFVGGGALADNDPPPQPTEPPPIEFRRGDVNADGVIDFLDVDDLAAYVSVDSDVDADDPLGLSTQFLAGPPEPLFTPPCLDAADVDDDGNIDASDVLYLAFVVACYFQTMLPAPGPWCGEDPTDDEITCEEPSCVEPYSDRALFERP